MIETDAIERRPSIAALSTWAVVAVVIVATVGAIGGVSAADPSASSPAPNATAASNASATEAAPPGAFVSSAIAVQEARTSQSYQEALLEEDLDRADSPAARERVRRAHLAALERDARNLSADWNRTRDGYASGSVPASVYRVKMTASAARANALRHLVERSAVDETESDRIVRELPGSGSAADRDWSDQSGRSTPARQSTATGPDRGVETVSDAPWSDEWPDPWADESDDRPGTNRSAGSDDRDDESDDAESADRGHEHRGSPPADGWETGDRDDPDGPDSNVVPADPADSDAPADPSSEDARDDFDDDRDGDDSDAPADPSSEDTRDDFDDDWDADDSADGAGPPGAGPDPAFGDDADEGDSRADPDAEDDDSTADPDEEGDSGVDPDDEDSASEQGETGFSGDPGVEELHPELADPVSNETVSSDTA
ncbi:hypothetical protein [Halococcoides cellulosivorans]|uniref:Uncharacterized protein n=1 Tax=Halococcoides cellulosivorans TaxID=1679096 RepID=A0A2R4X307_9EURY|nr:hypothetical protein [Halococcoides cellulosivorans]AWB28073.1 hypothetical protein HARCEL1_10325 [Halococcoides cellulosivorans]